MRQADPSASFYYNTWSIQAGSDSSKQVWHGQDTRIIQGEAWVGDRQTISRGLDRENKPRTRAGIRTQEFKLGKLGNTLTVARLNNTQQCV